jgi:hypothetical protein
LFKIDASRSSLRVGDLVTPDTVIGEDWATADLVKAGVEGTVEAISFSGVDHALLILVRPNH